MGIVNSEHELRRRDNVECREEDEQVVPDADQFSHCLVRVEGDYERNIQKRRSSQFVESHEKMIPE